MRAARAYTASSLEALRARALLKDWMAQGFLSRDQYAQLEKETDCHLRRTNIFLRLVLFLFTLLIIGATAGLFFVLVEPSSRTSGILLLIFAAVAYSAAELAVSQAKLYRYGIEEALAVCSVGFLCVGLQLSFFDGPVDSGHPRALASLVPAAGAIASLWIWHRFALIYAALAALIFVYWLPGYWTASPTAEHLILFALYAAGLITLITLRPQHRLTYCNGEYSIVEALVWVGCYLAINLQLSFAILSHGTSGELSRPFYWATWLFTWCWPPMVLDRGLRGKDRSIIAAGIAVASLTLITNKPYFGWPRNTWDPMLLGALLIGVAILVRRWLATGPGEIRHGFTAQRLSSRDQEWMSAGAIVSGSLLPHSMTPGAPADAPSVQFGGGSSGGGGATSDF